jgi:hypothetical protein
MRIAVNTSTSARNTDCCRVNIMPNTRRLICPRKLLQITAEEIGRLSMRELPLGESAYLASIVIDLHTTFVHYVGDVIMPTRYE